MKEFSRLSFDVNKSAMKGEIEMKSANEKKSAQFKPARPVGRPPKDVVDDKTLPLQLDDQKEVRKSKGKLSSTTTTAEVLDVDLQIGAEQPERELTTREVNQQISAEMKRDRAENRKKAKNSGTAVGVLQKVLKRHPNDPKRQLTSFLKDYTIYAGTGRRRQISERTLTYYGTFLLDVVEELRAKGASIQNINEINKKHALVLIKHWTDLNQNSGVIQNKISRLRCFLTWIGKDKEIPTHSALKNWLAENGVVRDFWTSTVAKESKAWSELGVDAQAVIKQVRAICELTAMQMEVQYWFGLRMRESVSFRPYAADQEDRLLVVDGTKGGRPRSFDFFQDPELRAEQRKVLDRAKMMSKNNRRGILALDGMSQEQAVKYFYDMLAKAGVSKKDMGVTPHGLRFAFASMTYEEHAGFAPPNSNRAPAVIDDEMIDRDRAARLKVTNALGHARIDVPKAYIGSIPMMKKERLSRLSTWVERLERNPKIQSVLQIAGVTQLWFGGSAALGMELPAHENLRLFVRFSKAGTTDRRVMNYINDELACEIPEGLDISEYMGTSSPDIGVEVFLEPVTFA
jgi:site-specific recombinase XerD